MADGSLSANVKTISQIATVGALTRSANGVPSAARDLTTAAKALTRNGRLPTSARLSIGAEAANTTLSRCSQADRRRQGLASVARLMSVPSCAKKNAAMSRRWLNREELSDIQRDLIRRLRILLIESPCSSIFTDE